MSPQNLVVEPQLFSRLLLSLRGQLEVLQLGIAGTNLVTQRASVDAEAER
jgi:hypothetical protein